MPREFDTVLEVGLSAENLWSLRQNTDFDEHLASYEKQVFALIDIKEDGKDEAGNQVCGDCLCSLTHEAPARERARLTDPF